MSTKQGCSVSTLGRFLTRTTGACGFLRGRLSILAQVTRNTGFAGSQPARPAFRMRSPKSFSANVAADPHSGGPVTTLEMAAKVVGSDRTFLEAFGRAWKDAAPVDPGARDHAAGASLLVSTR